MKLFIFQSGGKSGLRAFTGDADGKMLPPKFAPWGMTGIVPATKALPSGLPRAAVEREVRSNGFQLWRLRQKEH